MVLLSRKRKFIFFFILQFIVVSFLIKKYQNEILSGIEAFADKIRTTRGGVFILLAIIIVCSIPPIIGFDVSVLLCGFTYGFPRGGLPSTVGACVGAIVTFVLVRNLRIARFIKLSDRNQQKFHAMQLAIQQEGFKMVVLLRICPIPWQLTNLFLSLCETVDFKLYVITAFIGSFRFNLDVWVGSQLATLSNPNLPDELHQATMIALVVGLIILVTSGFWLYRTTMKKIKEIESNQETESLLQGEDQDYSTVVVV